MKIIIDNYHKKFIGWCVSCQTCHSRFEIEESDIKNLILQDDMIYVRCPLCLNNITFRK